MGNNSKTEEDRGKSARPSGDDVSLDMEKIEIPVISLSVLKHFYYYEVNSVSITIEKDFSACIRLEMVANKYVVTKHSRIREIDGLLCFVGLVKNLTVEVLSKSLNCVIFKEKLIVENLIINFDGLKASNIGYVLENLVEPVDSVTISYKTKDKSGKKRPKTIQIKKMEKSDLSCLAKSETGC